MRGVLDTSVVIAATVADLPDEAAISAATLAELHFGVHLATSAAARRSRIRRLSEIESRFDPLPIDAVVARSYGELAAIVAERGRHVRRRAMDLLIGATAYAHGVPLYTKDAADFVGIEDVIDLRVV